MNERYKWEVLAIVMVGTLMAALDSSIVNVSIPKIMADFGVGVDDIEWVVTGYMLAFATLMPITAWVRDITGHKYLYIASMITFTLGSVLCGFAWNLPSLVVARVIQAFGGGAVTPTGMAMISDVFEPHERGKAMGYWGVGVIIGPAIGPTIGGLITQEFSWRWIFLVNLPIGVLGIYYAIKLLRPDRPKGGEHAPFDFWGFFFLSLFLVAFLLGLSQGEKQGWGSAYIAWCWISSALGFGGFLLVESLTPNGIVDIRLFKSSVFTISMIVTAVRSVALFGGVFLLPVFLQNLMGFDEIESGLILLPGSLIVGFCMPIAGRLSDRIGPRWPTFFGLIFMIIFMYAYRTLDVTTSVWAVISPTLWRGVGLGLLMAPVTATVMNAVPRNKTGMASSMMALMQQVSGSMGIAILSTALAHRMAFHRAAVSAAFGAGSEGVLHAMRELAFRARELGLSHADARMASVGTLMKSVMISASVQSFDDAFLIGAAIVALALLPALLLPHGPVKKLPGPPDHSALAAME